jgi:hypothetical protein
MASGISNIEYGRLKQATMRGIKPQNNADHDNNPSSISLNNPNEPCKHS